MRVGSGVILFQLAGFLTSALADFYFAKHTLMAFVFHLGNCELNCTLSTISLYRSFDGFCISSWKLRT